MGKTALTNVRVFDGHKFSAPTTITIEDSLITSDPSGAHTLDCTSKYLLPGYIDCHVHLHGPETLTALATAGITTALDMATWPPSLLHSLRTQSQQSPGTPTIRSPGLPAIHPASRHAKTMPIPAADLVSSEADAEPYVAARRAEGVDYIKLVADVPGFDQPTLNALAAAAHEHGMFVIAHAASNVPFTRAMEAGVDIITHTPLDSPLTSTQIRALVAAKTVVVPTLVMMEGTAAFLAKVNPGAPIAFEAALQSVTGMHEAGVMVLVGTDANAAPGAPMQVAHGASVYREMELLVQAGMGEGEVLRGAGVEAARVFGLGDRGVVEVGRRADLVLLGKDPLVDIRNVRSVERIWIGGVEVERN